jgi:hypothetical protein
MQRLIEGSIRCGNECSRGPQKRYVDVIPAFFSLVSDSSHFFAFVLSLAIEGRMRVVFQRRRRSDELMALEAHFSSGCCRGRVFYHWWLLVNKVHHFSTAIIREEQWDAYEDGGDEEDRDGGGDGRIRGDGWRWEMMVAAEAMIDVWIRWVMCGLEAMSGGDGW